MRWFAKSLVLTLAACGGGEISVEDVDVVEPACQTDADCGSGESCWVNPVAAYSVCVPACQTDDDCEGDRQCRQMFDTVACVDPLPAEPPPEPQVDADDIPLGPGNVQCIGAVDGRVTIPFTLDEQTTSAMVIPFTTDGGSVRPDAWVLPDGQAVFSNGGAGILGVTSSLLGVTAPLFLPTTPVLEDLLVPGTHEYVVEATTEELCATVLLEDATTGTRLDLNLILVGLDDVDAASADDDVELGIAIDTLSDIFDTAGITIGTVRVSDAAPEVSDAFSVIDSQDDMDALMATSVSPGPSDEELLSVNLFLVSVIDLPNSAAIGVSQGLPGPAGIHGTAASGVVLTSGFLRSGNQTSATIGAELTGVVMAHEIGHWLGLFHTSELAGGVQDPLEDTPACGDIAERLQNNELDGCPDRANLMFPVADPLSRTLTADQASVLVANPVTR